MGDLEYAGEYSRKYYPKVGLDSFANRFDIRNGKPHYISIFKKQERDNFDSILRWNSTIAISVLTLSLIPVIFYKRIPKLRNFTSKKARVLWSMFFIFVPASIANAFQTKALTDFIQRRWYLRGEDFIKYKLTGDLHKINDEARLVDF